MSTLVGLEFTLALYAESPQVFNILSHRQTIQYSTLSSLFWFSISYSYENSGNTKLIINLLLYILFYFFLKIHCYLYFRLSIPCMVSYMLNNWIFQKILKNWGNMAKTILYINLKYLNAIIQCSFSGYWENFFHLFYSVDKNLFQKTIERGRERSASSW